MQTMARGVSTTWRPGASLCDISDPTVPGLVLRIAISGSKVWLFRFKWDGTPTRITLGKFLPLV